MAKAVVRPEDVFAFDSSREGMTRFGATLRQVGDHLGLEGIGCMHISVEPGKRAFPFHSHVGNDEMFVIISGKGAYRIGDEEIPVAAGAVCGAPRGGPETAHQLINTGAEPLTYLAISTQCDPDIVEYPDSGKFLAMAIKPGKDFMNAHLKFIGRKGSSLDYFDGEDA